MSLALRVAQLFKEVRLIRLSVRVEMRLFDAIQAAAQRAKGDIQALRQEVEAIVLSEDLFKIEREVTSANLGSGFDLEAMATAPDFWVRQAALRDYVERRVEQSVADLAPYLPASQSSAETLLSVYLIPGFTKCYSPTAGVQLFALRAEANPEEALLFLIHVYYHEVSSLFYTETSRRAAANPVTAELLKHWLLLLIQNEGLANYVVLDSLMRLRASGIHFAYFTYASLVCEPEPTARSMSLCRKILSLIDESNSLTLRSHILEYLKDPRLPVMNLVGIYLSQAIAATFNERELLAVADREPQEFFRLYGETGDCLSQYLFGPHGEAASLFGLTSAVVSIR